MPRQLIRLREVRKSDSFDDEKSTAEIQGVEASAVTDQDVLEAVISQIRRILGTADWKDSPSTTLATQPGFRTILSADCLPADAIGNFVSITGPPVGTRFQVATVDIGDPDKMPAVGVIVTKQTATQCDIQWFGEVSGIFTGLTPRKIHFVGGDGRPTATLPSAPGDFVQKVGIALAADSLLLNPSLDLARRS